MTARALQLGLDDVAAGIGCGTGQLRPPSRRAAFTRHIRNAIAAGPRFTEPLHVTALIGHAPT